MLIISIVCGMFLALCIKVALTWFSMTPNERIEADRLGIWYGYLVS